MDKKQRKLLITELERQRHDHEVKTSMEATNAAIARAARIRVAEEGRRHQQALEEQDIVNHEQYVRFRNLAREFASWTRKEKVTPEISVKIFPLRRHSGWIIAKSVLSYPVRVENWDREQSRTPTYSYETAGAGLVITRNDELVTVSDAQLDANYSSKFPVDIARGCGSIVGQVSFPELENTLICKIAKISVEQGIDPPLTN